MINYRKMFVGIAAAALVAVPLAACSSTTDSAPTSSTSQSTTTTQPAPAAEVDNLTGVSTAVELDPGFTAALTTLGLTPGVVGTATLADGSVSFPITGGNVKYWTPGTVDPYVQGTILHEGSGLSLASGDTTVELTNFDIDPGASILTGDVVVNGVTAATGATLFDLNGRTLQPLQTGPDNTAVLQGTQVTVSADAAALLNQTFNTTAVTPGLLVGVATITIATS